MEADLAREYPGTLLTDLWTGRLTLRRFGSLVRHLPVTSAVNRALGGDTWTTTDYLIADLIQAWTGELHPSDPRKRAGREQKDGQLEELRRRSLARRQQLGIQGSVLRRG